MTYSTNIGIREIRTRRGVGARQMRELDREARMPRLLDQPAGNADAGKGLRGQRVAVIGQGSIGMYFTDLLARSSVAALLLIDRALSKCESVLTHPLQPRDIGRPKAALAGEHAKAISPSTRVRVYDGPVEELGLEAFVDATAVLLASDNLACELEVNRICTQLSLPLIQSSVHGATLVAEVRSFANRAGGDGPCLACGYQAADWEALNANTQYSCTGGPTLANGVPTAVSPQLGATAASLGITELLLRSTGLVSASQSRQLTYCGFNHQSTLTALERRADCPCAHTSWRTLAWKSALGSATPRELFAAAGCTDDNTVTGSSMTVAGYRYSRLGSCSCAEHPELERFRAIGSKTTTCAACGDALEPHPFYTHEQVPGSALETRLDLPLAELGVDSPTTLLVHSPAETVFIHASLTQPRKPQESPR